LVRHGKGGELLMNRLADRSRPGLELIALDKGPGIRDVARCLQDGYSTAGSAGTGLGAVSRQSSDFEIYSLPERGTAVFARLWAAPTYDKPRVARLGAICIPYPGEVVSGDSWTATLGDRRSVITVVDGLGHGVFAAEAARTAIGVRSTEDQSAAERLEALHGALRATRGAAAAVAAIDNERALVTYAGVGNIAGLIIRPNGQTQATVSLAGIVGHDVRRIQPFDYAWPRGSVLVMHSDGLSSSWRLDHHPGLLSRDPALIAGVLMRDFSRGRDDATVVVLKDLEPGGRS
jgi:hypothetical protein